MNKYEVHADNIQTAVNKINDTKIDLDFMVRSLVQEINGRNDLDRVYSSSDTCIHFLNATIEKLSVLRENINDLMVQIDEDTAGPNPEVFDWRLP